MFYPHFIFKYFLYTFFFRSIFLWFILFFPCECAFLLIYAHFWLQLIGLAEPSAFKANEWHANKSYKQNIQFKIEFE